MSDTIQSTHTSQRILYAFVKLTWNLKRKKQGFPGGPVAKNLPPNAGDTDLILVGEDPTRPRATKPMCHNC